MVAKKLVIGIAVAVLSLTVVGTMLPTSSVWAATIHCKSGDDACFGTDADDTMIGEDGHNFMVGKLGDDTISAQGGDDVLEGDDGNDKLSGGQGKDVIFAAEGSDIISGGDGDDQIFHFSGSIQRATNPDGSQDKIDCGSGNDQVWINVSVDHDIITNCETVHAG